MTVNKPVGNTRSNMTRDDRYDQRLARLEPDALTTGQ